MGGVGLLACSILLVCAVSSVNSYSRSSLKPAPEFNIFASGSSSSSNPTHTYINHNSNNAKLGSSGMGSNGYQSSNGYVNTNNNNNNNGHNSGSGASNANGQNGSGQYNNPSIIDPHYVFGAPQSIPVLPNLPIFPYNSPTLAPSFQQFPQPNHPGNVLNPGVPQGLQPVNPYNPSFVFGQQPYYSAPGGTGGPPGGSAGILGAGGGGLAPYPGSYPSPNMYNKPPPQYQNQNPYNRQTQTHPNSAGRSQVLTLKVALLFAGIVGLVQKLFQLST